MKYLKQAFVKTLPFSPFLQGSPGGSEHVDCGGKDRWTESGTGASAQRADNTHPSSWSTDECPHTALDVTTPFDDILEQVQALSFPLVWTDRFWVHAWPWHCRRTGSHHTVFHSG